MPSAEGARLVVYATKCCRAPVYFAIGAEGRDSVFFHCGGCCGWMPQLRLVSATPAQRPPEVPTPAPKSYVRATRTSPSAPAAGGDDALAAMGMRVRRVARERRS